MAWGGTTWIDRGEACDLRTHADTGKMPAYPGLRTLRLHCNAITMRANEGRSDSQALGASEERRPIRLASGGTLHRSFQKTASFPGERLRRRIASRKSLVSKCASDRKKRGRELATPAYQGPMVLG